MNILLYPMIIPLAAGLLALMIPRAGGRIREIVALAGSIVAAVFAGIAAFGNGTKIASMEWFRVQQFAFSLDLRVDALSAFILFAISVFAVLIVIYSMGYMSGRERLNEYYAYLLWTSAAASTAVMADNLALLLIAWEIASVLLFFLMTMGKGDVRGAAGKALVVIGFSDCALLLGLAMLWQIGGTAVIHDIGPISISSGIHTAAYLLILTGALVKAGAVPGHTWIPAAAESAPAGVMAFLPASLDKLMGIYLLARLSLFIFRLNASLSMLLLIVGAVTIISAVFMALVQHDLKKLLAFHAVSQVGYMVMGIGTGVPVGIAGGLFHMLNHAVYKSCLFLCAGSVEKQAGTTELDDLGGLARSMPLVFGSFLVASLAISGVPPLNGFVSKWLVYQATIDIGKPIFLIAAMFGSVLTAASFIKVLHGVFLGKRPECLKTVGRTGFAMALPMVILAAVCIVFGVFAQVPLRRLIAPVAGIEVQGVPDVINLVRGTWSPALATLLLITAVMFGLLMYWISSAKIRQTTIFFGGENLDEESLRYSGTGFYETVSKFAFFKTLYPDAEQGIYDLYVLGGRHGLKIVEALRSIHNGVVSTYVAFSLIGLGVLIFFLVR